MKTIKGDLIELAKNGTFNTIVHGCNCFHTMGAGVALTIVTNFPEVLISDKRTGYGDITKLGSISGAVVQTDTGLLHIINAYTQFYYGNLHKEFDYIALRKCFRKIRIRYIDMRIGYPMIGSNLGKGNWSIISKIIDEELEGLDHTVVVQ